MSTDDLLLPRVAAGDARAVRQCVERFGALVWSLARRWAPNVSDAEDVVQDVFLDLWRSANRFDPELSSEAGFVAMIARRRLIDLGRRRVRRESEGAEVTMVANPTAEDSAEVTLVRRALGRLRPEEREVLVLASLDGLSHQEISERTGLPLGTVKTHCRRGLLRVRELLGRDADGHTPQASMAAADVSNELNANAGNVDGTNDSSRVTKGEP